MKSTDVAAAAVQTAPTGAAPTLAPRTSSIKRALFGTIVADTAVLVIGIATGPIAARLLQPEGRGAVAAVLFWPVLLAGIGLLSLNEATTYRIGARPERSESVTASSFTLAIIFAFITTCTGLLLIARLLGPARADLVGIATVYMVVFVPCNFIALTLIATDHGELRFTKYNLQRISVPATYLLGLIALWATNRVSVAAVIAVHCLATVIAAGGRLISQFRSIIRSATWEDTRALLRLSLSFHPASVLMFLATQADQFVVLTLWNNEMLGKYVVALTICSSSLTVVGNTFQRVLFPHIARRSADSNPEHLMARGIRIASLIMVLASICLALMLPWIVPLAFGQSFRGSVGPGQFLLFSYIFVAVRNLMIQSLRGLGQARPGIIGSAIAVTFFLPLAYFLGQRMGLYGIAAALGIANLFAVGYLAQFISRKWKVGVSELCGLTPATFLELWAFARSSWARAGAL